MSVSISVKLIQGTYILYLIAYQVLWVIWGIQKQWWRKNPSKAECKDYHQTKEFCLVMSFTSFLLSLWPTTVSAVMTVQMPGFWLAFMLKQWVWFPLFYTSLVFSLLRSSSINISLSITIRLLKAKISLVENWEQLSLEDCETNSLASDIPTQDQNCDI